jgi:hypothetical protein
LFTLRVFSDRIILLFAASDPQYVVNAVALAASVCCSANCGPPANIVAIIEGGSVRGGRRSKKLAKCTE